MGFSFNDFLNEVNPTKKKGFIGSIFADDTVRKITGPLADTFVGGLSFMNNFSGNLQKTVIGVSEIFTGDTLYLVLLVGGGFVVIYGVKTLTSK